MPSCSRMNCFPTDNNSVSDWAASIQGGGTQDLFACIHPEWQDPNVHFIGHLS